MNKNLPDKFKIFVSKNKLFNSEDKILLAVSGGIDSVVMCELFHESKINFGIAHCNFNLRGKESEEDEKFVKILSKKYKVSFFSKKFATRKFAKSRGESIQMAARELRFNWFEKLRKKNKFNFIAIATQLDDEIETSLINLLRGTGISGLHGIFPKKNKIIRPLLFASRHEILEFAAKKNLSWREDSSNNSDAYIRNKIRHKIVPVLKEINPDIEKTFSENIERFRDAEEIFRQQINEKQKELFIKKSKVNEIIIPIEKLLLLSPLRSYLFEFLKPFGFNETQVKEIMAGLRLQPGKKYISETHCIYKDRGKLIITKQKRKFIDTDLIGGTPVYGRTPKITNPVRVLFRVSGKKDIRITGDEKTAFLDYNKLCFPLIIRRWKPGDFFVPFGMEGRKKISDFLTDEKIPLPQKEKIFVLTSMGKIAWVVGKRIDNRFRVEKTTKKIFISKLL